VIKRGDCQKLLTPDGRGGERKRVPQTELRFCQRREGGSTSSRHTEDGGTEDEEKSRPTGRWGREKGVCQTVQREALVGAGSPNGKNTNIAFPANLGACTVVDAS